ncbi:UDP-glycosyltransferase 72E1 [Gossypium hirsutum]|uniref:Glycosyltransferase n=1 Tax=Gossypium hirsutum TaxID=3635 RepID=A0A1U8MX95_GOSHI|nr:UDP-glycosyltransferase 72E1-like [Gossypium hirsutum]
METTKSHIALLASPGMGHLIPVLELAKHLVSHQSFKVTVFVVATDHASLANTHLLQSPADSGDLLDIVLLPFIDVSDIGGPSVSFIATIVTTVLRSMPFLRSEISKMEFRPTALVVDLFGTDALEIADEYNMLKFVFIASNAWFLAVMLCTPEIDRKEIDEHVKNHELEPTTLKALRETKKVPIYPIGPLVRPIEKSVFGNEILAWLNKQPKQSVIYVSFGSGGTLSAQQVKELAWGLELSQQRFVWVLRPPTENDAAGTFLALGNGSDATLDYLPDGFPARTQDRGLLVPMWAPQVEVLSHPSIGGFLTHCGWNSTMESIVNGVPMIAWPLYAEQKMNASMLTEDIGASIRVMAVESDAAVGREEIRSVVRKILVDRQGRNIRSRIKELKDNAANALAKGGSSYNSMSQVANICIQHLKTKASGS